MSKVVFGDNHFFGINHLSVQKAQDYRARFADRGVLADSFRMLARYDVGDQMMSAHRHAACVCQVAREVHPTLTFHPVIPYAHSINDEAAVRGLLGTAFRLLRPSVKDLIKLVFQMINRSVEAQIPSSSIRRFVDSQLQFFGDIPMENRGVLFLNNVFSDLLVGLGAYECFDHFREACLENGYEAGIITYNPSFVFRNPLPGFNLCIHYNCKGFLNNLTGTELNRLSTGYPIWAMGIFGSGAYSEEEVLEDLRGRPFQKVVFASSKEERLKRFVAGV